MYFSLILLVWCTFEVWQPDMWVCSPRHSLTMTMLFHVLNYEIVELRMDMGGMFWIRSHKVGGWLWVVLEILSMWLRCSISCILICLSLVWLLAKFGTRSDLVKPTGHARFSVELFRLFWKLINYFHKKINWTNGGLFDFFTFLLWNLL